MMAAVEANGVTLGVEHFGHPAAPLVLRDSGASTSVSSKAPAYTLPAAQMADQTGMVLPAAGQVGAAMFAR